MTTQDSATMTMNCKEYKEYLPKLRDYCETYRHSFTWSSS